MITWGDVIDIILNTFNISQTKLSELMDYNKDSISKMKHGKAVPSTKIDVIYDRVFYPATTDSPAYQYGNTNNLASCLEAVKDTINSKKTPFPAVREAMDDMWDETDYKEFVCKLLSRAKKGPSSKIKSKETESDNSNDFGETATSSGLPNNKNFDTKSEEAPPKEMPSDQMRKIFAEAVAEYNVASCICSLSYFLKSGPNYDFRIDCFIETIQDDLLSKFINHQNECVYEEITEFLNVLESYMDSTSFLNPDISKPYGIMMDVHGCSATLDKADKDYCDQQNSSTEGKPVDDKPTNSSKDELTKKQGQLYWICSALRAYNRLSEIYSKICPGQTLLVF